MLGVGEKFPDFDLPSCDADNNLGRTSFISSTNQSVVEAAETEMCEDKWHVFYFYPKDFTFICPTEIKQMDRLVDYQVRPGVHVVGFSGDNEFCKKAWKESNDLIKDIRHPLVADTGLLLSEKLGIVDWNEGVCRRATFIVDPSKTIQHASENALDTGRNVDEVIRTLKALQSGGLTACNWQIGDDFVG
tara:strand:- start:413 stop:979 length:567 start_codon:yes stop_codon:yes gene_type:complete